jgi:thioredoxin 1
VRKFVALVGLIVLLFGFSMPATGNQPSEISKLPVEGMVTLVDIGSDQCIPCKLMKPILQELQEEYQGKAVIVFVDLWKNPDQNEKFDISVIPTQIFYDQAGKEVFRHEGFLDKKRIVENLEKLGVKQQ